MKIDIDSRMFMSLYATLIVLMALFGVVGAILDYINDHDTQRMEVRDEIEKGREK